MKENEKAAAADGVDFATFVFSLATGAFIQMGEIPDPATGKKEKNLQLAQQNIDILLLLKAKTKGNLSSDEGQMLESLLSQAQLKFVEVSGRK
jgi:hypothetical protein